MDQDIPVGPDVAAGQVYTRAVDVPEACRTELVKLMTGFIDSELACAAGLADVVNLAPGLEEAMGTARIVHEKIRAAHTVLKVLDAFGTDTQRYAKPHPWARRMRRDADIGQERPGCDRRLALFNYPVLGWTDTVVLQHLMGNAVVIQLEEYSHVCYRPLAEAFQVVAVDETRHTTLAREGVARQLARDDRKAVQASVTYWWPRVADTFGATRSDKYLALRRLGLRHRPNHALRRQWETEMRAFLDRAHLSTPMTV